MSAERRTRWTNDRGADGLRDKFHVYSAADAMPWHQGEFTGYSTDRRLGATGEFVFVLRPESDEAAYWALREYAIGMKHRSPRLAKDIHAQLDRIVGAQRA